MRLQNFAIFLAIAATAAAAKSAVTADSSNTTSIQTTITPTAVCCDALEAAGLGDRITYPGLPAYEGRIRSYWSVTAQLRPRCIVQPADAGEVSLIVRTLDRAVHGSTAQYEGEERAGCRFAVRSGGHMPWAGAANIDDGVTVDLGLLNATTYFAANASAAIQPGARWGSVYQALEEHDVVVAGARVSTVGVGGFVLGGGISFWSMREGWVCDSVENFEVVLASGEIVNANRGTNSDLFHVLKGSSNNFGIVTRIDLPTFKQVELWGGSVVYPFSTAPQHMRALVDLIDRLDEDSTAAILVMLRYTSEDGEMFVTNSYEYTQPVQRPAIFDNFLAIPGNFSDTMRLSTIRGLTDQFEEKLYLSDSFTTTTFQNDEAVLNKATELFERFVEKLKSEVGGDEDDWTATAVFQPLPPASTSHSRRNGGNVLGIERFETKNIIFLCFLIWKDRSKTLALQAAANQLVRDIEDFARGIGKYTPFRYLNYANADQDPLATYGAENVAKMRAAAAKYDPRGVFQHLVPGGFKISKVRGDALQDGLGDDDVVN